MPICLRQTLTCALSSPAAHRVYAYLCSFEPCGLSCAIGKAFDEQLLALFMLPIIVVKLLARVFAQVLVQWLSEPGRRDNIPVDSPHAFLRTWDVDDEYVIEEDSELNFVGMQGTNEDCVCTR